MANYGRRDHGRAAEGQREPDRSATASHGGDLAPTAVAITGFTGVAANTCRDAVDALLPWLGRSRGAVASLSQGATGR
jgi:hypothetical protein